MDAIRINLADGGMPLLMTKLIPDRNFHNVQHSFEKPMPKVWIRPARYFTLL